MFYMLSVVFCQIESYARIFNNSWFMSYSLGNIIESSYNIECSKCNMMYIINTYIELSIRSWYQSRINLKC